MPPELPRRGRIVGCGYCGAFKAPGESGSQSLENPSAESARPPYRSAIRIPRTPPQLALTKENDYSESTTPTLPDGGHAPSDVYTPFAPTQATRRNMMFQTIAPYVAPTALLLSLYFVAGFSVKHKWKHRIVLSPLKIIAASDRRASLSAAQISFFTAVILWVAAYWTFRTGELVLFDKSALGLLGVTVLGTTAGKVTDSTRFRLTSENWSWAKRKRWIKNDFTRAHSDYLPTVGDLMSTDRDFDITRLQAVGFSLLVGTSLFYGGLTAADAQAFSDITVPNVYLGLIGISQSAYVAGKYTGGNFFRELGTQLDNIRKMEASFVVAVAKSPQWNEEPSSQRTINLAIQCAASEYHEFLHAAKDAAELVGNMTGNVIDLSRIQPSLPANAGTSSLV